MNSRGERTFPRASYAECGKAQRQAVRRAQDVDGIGENGKPIFSRTDWKALHNVFGATTSYSKLVDQVERKQLAVGLSERQVSRSLRKFAEHGVIGYAPGLGSGNPSVVVVPPHGAKADEYLSSLRKAYPSSFPPVKATESTGKTRRTRARDDAVEKPRRERRSEERTKLGITGSSSRPAQDDVVETGTDDEKLLALVHKNSRAGRVEQSDEPVDEVAAARERHRRETSRRDGMARARELAAQAGQGALFETPNPPPEER